LPEKRERGGCWRWEEELTDEPHPSAAGERGEEWEALVGWVARAGRPSEKTDGEGEEGAGPTWLKSGRKRGNFYFSNKVSKPF